MTQPTEAMKQKAFELIRDFGGSDNVSELRSQIAVSLATTDNEGYERGRRDALREVRSAIEELIGEESDGNFLDRDEVFAAIDRFKEGDDSA